MDLPVEFFISGVPKFPQIDNPVDPLYTCAPTSVGMGMAYCLELVGLTKEAVGCGPDTQIEAYINEVIADDQTWNWIVQNNARFGGWMVGYVQRGNPRRQILAVEAYAFDRLMREHGFTAEYKALPGYHEYCQTIFTTQLPVILAGDFRTVSRVGGHVTCGIGYNSRGLQEVIVNDPFGNAMRGYPAPNDCVEARYPARLYVRSNPTRIDAIVISELDKTGLV